MRKLNIIFMAILLIITIIVFAVSVYKNPIKNRVCFSQTCFNVEIVSTPEELEKGLMFRESLGENSGMLFVFSEEGIYKFWMKNTLIPLDMVWLNSNKEIIYIEKNVQPCVKGVCETFGPDEKAKYVLEISTGSSDKARLKIGDKAGIFMD